MQASYRARAELADPLQVTSLMGQPVALCGRTLRLDSEDPIGLVDADLYVIVNGIRRVLPVTSDADGYFSVDFSPLAGEAGHVLLGACYPGLGSTEAQDEFDILGLRFVKSICGSTSSSSYVHGVTMNDVNVAAVAEQPQSCRAERPASSSALRQLRGPGTSETPAWTSCQATLQARSCSQSRERRRQKGETISPSASRSLRMKA